MAWTAITEDDLREYLSGQELEAFRRATMSPGDEDPVQGIIDKVTALIRSYVMACPRYTLAGAGLIPDLLLDAACSMIVVKIMARAGGVVLDQGGERKKAAEVAKALLKEIAMCKGPIITLPTDAEGTGSETAPGILLPEYQPPLDPDGNDLVQEFDRESQDGI
jgi:hypothetical protein